MGLFSKPEVVILKDSCDSKDYLSKLQELRTTVSDSSVAAEKIDKEIAITESGIIGEGSVLFELKNSCYSRFIYQNTGWQKRAD